MHPGGLTALVGREEELELLLRRWARAKTGEGQVVLLSGEAGIGKSRLSAALMEGLAAEPHTRLALFLLAAAHRQRFLSDHRAVRTCRRICARRHTANKARQARCAAGADLDVQAGRGALRRDVVASQRRTLPRSGACSRTAPAENAGGTRRTIGNPGALQPRAHDLGGCALGRPHEPGSVRSHGGPDREPSRAVDRDVSAGVRGALGRTTARNSA